MQVDVIEAQSTELAKQIAYARDFRDAETAHEVFLSSLVEQFFLDMQPLAEMLAAIYALCLRLCSIIQVAGTTLLHPFFLSDLNWGRFDV